VKHCKSTVRAEGDSILFTANFFCTHPIRLKLQWYGRLLIFLAVAFCAWSLDCQAHGQGEPRRLLIVWAGTLPIILSAPHGGRQAIPGVPARTGVGVAQFTTERDANTDELTEKIAAKLEAKLSAKPFLAVAQFHRKYVDANRPSQGAFESAEAKPYYDAYHRVLRDARDRVRREWGGGLLLDIHGQGAQGETIYRGTNNGKTVMSLTRRFGAEAIAGPKSILGWLSRLGYRILPHQPHREDRYTGGYIVNTYGSHHGIGVDAIQLEIGSTLRGRANLERMANDLADAIAVFAQEFLPVIKTSAGAQAISPPSP
jgi:N-formylglutamate amidohydrolase